MQIISQQQQVRRAMRSPHFSQFSAQQKRRQGSEAALPAHVVCVYCEGGLRRYSLRSTVTR